MPEATSFSPISIPCETAAVSITLTGLGLRSTDVVRAETGSCTPGGGGLLLTSGTAGGVAGARTLPVTVPSTALTVGTYLVWYVVRQLREPRFRCADQLSLGHQCAIRRFGLLCGGARFHTDGR